MLSQGMYYIMQSSFLNIRTCINNCSQCNQPSSTWYNYSNFCLFFSLQIWNMGKLSCCLRRYCQAFGTVRPNFDLFSKKNSLRYQRFMAQFQFLVLPPNSVFNYKIIQKSIWNRLPNLYDNEDDRIHSFDC